MYNLVKIEEELRAFREKLELDSMTSAQKLNYMMIYRHILEAGQMSDEELIARAKKIKPLVRLRKSESEIEMVVGQPEPGDLLVFTNPVCLRQSYTYNFKPDSIVRQNDSSPLPVEGLREIARFTGYHDYGGFYGFYRPGADEVLSQIPVSVNIDEVSAFEIQIDTSDFWQVYDRLLDKHVSTVILYAMEGGLPEQMRQQEVILKGVSY